MSRRVIDMRGEKAMGVFLDKYFYSRAKEARMLSYVERIYDKQLQLQGIDVLLDDYSIDEKAQLYYINRPVDSFAFEIDYVSEVTNSVVDGWYINPTNKTQDYLLLWIPKARTTHINRLVSEDFEVVEADLISKTHIKEYLEKLGVTDQTLKVMASEMRNKNKKRYSISGNIHLTYSLEGYTEKPINMVIKKALLDSLSQKRFEIRKEGITSIH
jgi:hypothetical protein